MNIELRLRDTYQDLPPNQKIQLIDEIAELLYQNNFINISAKIMIVNKLEGYKQLNSGRERHNNIVKNRGVK